MEHSFKELSFLDILIKNKNEQIITDIYHKPTDTQIYLHFKSHPSQKKTAWNSSLTLKHVEYVRYLQI